jgi:hypothetical protein
MGNHAAAVSAYQEAMRLFPRAQSPRLSLAMSALRQGDRRTGRHLLSPLRASAQQAEDPWWVYPLCEGRDADALLSRLRHALGSAAR